MNIDFRKIIKRSWEIIKKNKILWILGMLLGGASVGSGGGGSGYDFDSSDVDKIKNSDFVDGDQLTSAIDSFLTSLSEVIAKIPPYIWILIIVTLISVIILGIIVKIYLNNWAEGAVIGLVNGAEKGEEISFRKGAIYGIRFAKRLVLISIVPGLIYFLILIAFGLLIVFSLLFPVPVLNIILAIIFGFILIFFMLIGSLFLSLLKIISIRIVVVEDKDYLEAYKEAFTFVKKAFLEIIIQGVINYSFGCGFGCLYLIFLIVIIGIIILGFFIHVGLGLPLALLGLLILIVSGVFVGAFNSFKSANWTLLYKQVREKQKEGDNAK